MKSLNLTNIVIFSFFFASRVINFKCFLIFFNIFDGKIKLLCFLKGKGGNKIIFITLYITIIYKFEFKQIRIFRVYSDSMRAQFNKRLKETLRARISSVIF